MDKPFLESVVISEIEANNIEPSEHYQVTPFTIKLSKARFVIAFIFGIYAIYLASILFKELRWDIAFDLKADFNTLLYSLYPHAVIYGLSVCAYFMFLLRLAINHRNLLTVGNLGIHFYGHPHALQWKHVIYVSNNSENISFGLNPIISSALHTHKVGLLGLFFGKWHAQTYPAFNTFFMDADIEELTHALRYHLRQYRLKHPDNGSMGSTMWQQPG